MAVSETGTRAVVRRAACPGAVTLSHLSASQARGRRQRLPVGSSAACVTRDLWTLCGVVARVSVEETGGPAHRLSPRLSARMGLVVRILVGLSPSRKGWFCCIASDGDGCSSSIITLGDGATCAHTSRELASESVGRDERAERRHAAGRHRVAVVVHEGAEQLLPLLDALPGLLQLRGDLG